MKYTILLSSAILFATALTPMSAYADDQNLLCRRSGNECASLRGAGNGKISISGLDFNVKSSNVSNRNTNRNTVDTETNDSAVVSNETAYDRNTEASPNDGDSDASNIVDADSDTENGNDTVADNNTNPPQLNSNDIKGFDPFGGLYGPGT